MSTTPDDAAAALQFIDRSRWESYHQHCPRACYLNYYHGATQHGIRQVAAALPLTTGTYLHEPIGALTLDVLREPAMILREPDRYVARVRHHVAQARALYESVITLRGFDDASRVGVTTSANPGAGKMSAEEAFALGIPPSDEDGGELQAREILHTIAEQNALIEGFCWLYAIYVLPSILERYRLVSVEQEEAFIVPGTCTCELGDAYADWRVHRARGCLAMVFMSKPDLVVERLTDGKLEYHEFKTTGQYVKAVQDQWEHRPQFLVGIRGVEARLGEGIIDAAGVHHFIKGQRKGEYQREEGDYGGPRRQQSPLCYLYHRPAVPPVQAEDWQPSWKYFDGERNRTLGKLYDKKPVWLQRFPVDDPAMSPVEYWTRALPEHELQKCYGFVGPIPRQRFMEQEFLQSVRYWGSTITGGLSIIREAFAAGDIVTARMYLAAFFPQSWDCHPFGTGICQFIPICTGQIDLVEAEHNPKYQYRLPHHQPELDVAVEEGWLALPASEAERVQDEGGES